MSGPFIPGGFAPPRRTGPGVSGAETPGTDSLGPLVQSADVVRQLRDTLGIIPQVSLELASQVVATVNLGRATGVSDISRTEHPVSTAPTVQTILAADPRVTRIVRNMSAAANGGYVGAATVFLTNPLGSESVALVTADFAVVTQVPAAVLMGSLGAGFPVPPGFSLVFLVSVATVAGETVPFFTQFEEFLGTIGPEV